MVARESLKTRVVFSEPGECGGFGGCQMQPRIAEDHGHVTLKLSIFCVVLTFFNFQNNKIYQMF